MPDLPPPPPPQIPQPRREFTDQDRERIAFERAHNLNLGATIFDHTVSQVQWTDHETGISCQAICGFDIGLLAGIGSFVRDGETYSLSLTHSDFDTTEIPRSSRKFPLNIPEIAPGQILITSGDLKNSNSTASLQIIRDLTTPKKIKGLSHKRQKVCLMVVVP